MLNNQISNSLSKNHLKLFDDAGNVSATRTSEFLDISKSLLADALGLTIDQLRDDRLTGKAKERLENLAMALEFVSETFDGDINKTKFWIKTPNLNFGGFSPHALILRGKYRKVIDFILAAKSSKG